MKLKIFSFILGLTTCLSVDFFGQAEIDPFGEIENINSTLSIQ
jgi:hypothetical protein